MPGVFNVYNALAVIAVCTRIGVPPQTVSESLSDATVTGRFEIINALSYCTVVIDYAHNASSMKNLLETAVPIILTASYAYSVLSAAVHGDDGVNSARLRRISQISVF